jgi:large conductance mechanosensitive channel
MWQEFKAFAFKGNLLDVAIGFVLGVAFTALVNSAVTDLITPIIAAIGGKQDFDSLTFTINGSVFRYGHFLNVLISFLIIAFVLFWIVKVVTRLRPADEDKPAAIAQCPYCRETTAADARRCPHCTSELQPAA